jgi:hypothetical protein
MATLSLTITTWLIVLPPCWTLGQTRSLKLTMIAKQQPYPTTG